MLSVFVAQSLSAQDPVVDLTNSGDTTANVIAQLATQTHTTISVSKSLRDEVLILHVAQQPFSVVMNQIAYALDASWTRTNDGITLRRTSDDASAMKERDLASRMKEAAEWKKDETNPRTEKQPTIGETVAAMVKFSKNHDFEDAATVDVLNRSNPITDLTSRLVDALPTRVIADVAPGDRVVFCDRPTSMQRSFTSAMFEARRQPLARATAILKALRGKPIDKQVNEFFAMLTAGNRPMVVILSKRTVNLPTECAVGFIEPNGQFSQLPGGSWDDVARDNFDGEAPREARSGNKPTGQVQKHLRVSTSKLARAIAAARIRQPNKPRLPLQFKLSQADLDMILTPTKIEPWSWMLGETLVNLARARGASLVVHPADFISGLASQVESVDVEALMDDITRSRHDVDSKDGWLRIRPSVPVWAAKGHVDRRRFQDWIRYVALAEQHPIVETGRLISPLPGYGYCEPFMFSSIELAPAASRGLSETLMSPYAAKLISSLTPDQFRRAQGAGIPVGELSSAQIGWLVEMTYGVEGRVFGPERRESDRARDSGDDEDNLLEPTIVLPNGILTTAILKLSVETIDGWIPNRPEFPAPRFMGQPRTGASIGYAIAAQDQQLAMGRTSNYDFTSFYAARIRDVKVRLEHDPNLTTAGREGDVQIDASKTVRYDDLGADVKKAIQEAITEVQKNAAARSQKNQPR